MDFTKTAAGTDRIVLRDGVRAVLEQAKFKVTPVTIEQNQTVPVSVDFLTVANGQQSIVKCLENPEGFKAADLQTLVGFFHPRGVSQFMLIGDGSFDPEVMAIAHGASVNLVDRQSYQRSLAALPPDVLNALQKPGEPVVQFRAKSAFDEVPDCPTEAYNENAEGFSEMEAPAAKGYPAPSGGYVERGLETAGMPSGKRKSNVVGLIVAAALVVGVSTYLISKLTANSIGQNELDVGYKGNEVSISTNAGAVDVAGLVEAALIESMPIADEDEFSKKERIAKFDASQDFLLKMLLAGNRFQGKEKLENEIKRIVPTFKLEGSTVVFGKDAGEVKSRIKNWARGATTENSEFGHVSAAMDGELWTWIFHGKQVSREELLQEALRHGGMFVLNCAHCGANTSYELTAHAKGHVAPRCGKCELVMDVFGPDTEGNYRRANDFLTGFKIPQANVNEYLPINEEFREPEDHILAHWSAILDRCDYEYDSTREGHLSRDIWKLPEQTWADQVGDCEDTTFLLADALISAGFDARVALGIWQGGGHAWCVVKVNGRQRILETTMAHTEAVSLRSIIDVGGEYVALCLVDRENIYLRKDAAHLSTPDYFSGNYWKKVPVKGIQEDAAFASQAPAE